MAIKLKENYKYSLLVPTSMGIRMTPVNRQPVNSSEDFKVHVTSAETNVASISSFLGLPVKVMTALVKDSPIAHMIKTNLLGRNMKVEAVEIPQGDPWGYRHQINIADSGFGLRGPRVLNDRAGEVGRLLNTDDFDLEKIFAKHGVQILHMSGLIAALSKETGRFCLDLAKVAKKNGTMISFDLNYRASFWKNREDELKELFDEISLLSDILIGNEEDFQLCLGVQGPKSGGENIGSEIESFKSMINCVKEKYPDVSVYATTLREVINSNTHLWGAIVMEGDNFHVVEPRQIEVLDRIGGGDGFVGGLLYSILKKLPSENWIKFAWASGALAVTFLTDYAQPVDEEQIWNIWHGNARVKR